MAVGRHPLKFRSFFQDRRKWIAGGLLTLVILLAAFLRFYHLGAGGVGNEYYAATVKSMLTSWHNFFFAAFEPGGSISVDKPPLGFWVQALSAYFLGVNGFALALPNAIAGVLSVFLVYKLVRRPFGPWAGLAAALALALMPVAISTERNNTIDGLLVFVLLLAAWAFLQSVYTGRIRWLFVGAFIVGLGFNIKMLQAFLPLPAFYALYFFGAKHKWWKKVLHLSAATVLLLIVSFSWAIIVDLVPAADRPYVDSTNHNTVMELIFGHNGVERLINLRQGMGFDGDQDGLFGPISSYRSQPQGGNPAGGFPQMQNGQDAPQGSSHQPPGDGFPRSSYGQDTPQGYSSQSPDGSLPEPPSGEDMPQGYFQQPPGGQNIPQGIQPIGGQSNPRDGGGQSGSMDFGQAGTLRLFTEPLVGEASWLLPFVLAGLVILVVVLWKQPFGDRHLSVILWAGWLLPEAIYFTYSQGLMHAYYLIMMGAPIAALAAMTGWALWQLIQKRPLWGWGLIVLLAGGTLAFQTVTLWGTTTVAPWAVGGAVVIFGLGLCFLALSMLRSRFAPIAVGLLLAAMLVAPAAWSALTILDSAPIGSLPTAGSTQSGLSDGRAGARLGAGDGMGAAVAGNENSQNQSLLDYLLANTQPGTYLIATDRASDAASYILETGRPVLAIGGFLGQYQEVSIDQFVNLVTSGQLRFVFGQSLQQYEDISQWVQENCTAVDVSSVSGENIPASGNPGGNGQAIMLYDCGE